MKYLVNHTAKVRVAKSRIEGGGNGLFATEFIPKGSLVCTYGGELIDPQEAQYVSPIYTVNFELGKGLKLVGDGEGGDVGHYANAVHPLSKDLKQNARFSLSHNHKQIFPNNRGRFQIYAKEDIEVGDEIIVNYGKGYWKVVSDWFTKPRRVKSSTVLARDARAQHRQAAKYGYA